MTAYQRAVSAATLFGFAAFALFLFAAIGLRAFGDLDDRRFGVLFVSGLAGLVVGGLGMLLSMLSTAADGPSARAQLRAIAIPEVAAAKALLPELRRRSELFVSFDGLDVGIRYAPGDPGVHTFANGDPGYPPTGPDVEIVYALVEDGDELGDTFGEGRAALAGSITRYDEIGERWLWAESVLLPGFLLDDLQDDEDFYAAACDAIQDHEDALLDDYAEERAEA